MHAYEASKSCPVHVIFAVISLHKINLGSFTIQKILDSIFKILYRPFLPCSIQMNMAHSCLEMLVFFLVVRAGFWLTVLGFCLSIFRIPQEREPVCET